MKRIKLPPIMPLREVRKLLKRYYNIQVSTATLLEQLAKHKAINIYISLASQKCHVYGSYLCVEDYHDVRQSLLTAGQRFNAPPLFARPLNGERRQEQLLSFLNDLYLVALELWTTRLVVPDASDGEDDTFAVHHALAPVPSQLLEALQANPAQPIALPIVLWAKQPQEYDEKVQVMGCERGQDDGFITINDLCLNVESFLKLVNSFGRRAKQVVDTDVFLPLAVGAYTDA